MYTVWQYFSRLIDPKRPYVHFWTQNTSLSQRTRKDQKEVGSSWHPIIHLVYKVTICVELRMVEVALSREVFE